MADTIKKIGIQNDDGSYNYTDIGVDADKVDIGNTTLDQKISTIETDITNHTTALGNKVDKISGKGLSTNDYTTTEKTKLDGIAEGAEVNQNAFANVVVGSTTIAADAKSDSLTLVAGSNVTITPDATNDKITIAATDTKYSAATTSAAGLMSAADKTKLDGIAEGAGAVTVDTALSSTSTNPVQNKVVNTAINAKAPTSHASSATTYGKGTTSQYGHLKISDDYTTSPSTSYNASAGIAASMYSAQKLYNYAQLLDKRLGYLDDNGHILLGTATFTGLSNLDLAIQTRTQRYGTNSAIGNVKLSENMTNIFNIDLAAYSDSGYGYRFADGIQIFESSNIPTRIKATSDDMPKVYRANTSGATTYHHPDVYNPITSAKCWDSTGDNLINIGSRFEEAGGFAYTDMNIGFVGVASKDQDVTEANLQSPYYTAKESVYFLTNGPGIMYFYEKITL